MAYSSGSDNNMSSFQAVSSPKSSFTTPSYAISYGQLQDLIRIQTSIIVKLQCKVEKQGENVSKEEYDELRLQLENETVSHLKTKSQLLKKEKELEFALSDVNILAKELEREVISYGKICSELQMKAEEKEKENCVLLGKCSEIQEVCGFQDDILNFKENKIKDLKAKLVKQTRYQRMMVEEAELKLQQERFLSEQNYRPDEEVTHKPKHAKTS